jgi:hypothetical protein
MVQGYAILHELVHAAQYNILGIEPMGARHILEERRFGHDGQYAISPQLARIPFEQVNIVDSRFTVESIAHYLEDGIHEMAFP